MQGGLAVLPVSVCMRGDGVMRFWAERVAGLVRRGWRHLQGAVAWVRRAPLWLMAALWLAGGLVAGALLALQILAHPFFGWEPASRPAAGVRMAPLGELAAVAGPLVQEEAGVVQLVWRVTNVGDHAWSAATYRFSPGARDLPVVPLPRNVPPRETITVLIRLSLPPEQGERELIWHLSGPNGQVTGAELIARINLAGN